MTTILISTILEDIHAAAVALVLESTGHRPVRWFSSDFPQISASSFSIGTQMAESLQFRDYFGAVSLEEIDVFWNRRVGSTILKYPLAESDKAVAIKESTRFLHGVLQTISQQVFSVNGYQEARAAANKLVQLRAARGVGLLIPDTLISNDPHRIRSFLLEHEGSGTIFKSFKPATWVAEDRVATVFTSKVSLDVLPEDELLRLTPSIFQTYVQKAYEVRVTCMGSTVVAAQLHSQATERGRVDWRVVSPHELSISRIVLPEDIKRKCIALLQRLGLVFGCFDFIVTPSGEYVFLEVNQMGQFLWIEEVNPEIPLLQMFCEFLVSGDPEFCYSEKKHRSSFAEIREAAEVLIKEDFYAHLQVEQYDHIYQE